LRGPCLDSALVVGAEAVELTDPGRVAQPFEESGFPESYFLPVPFACQCVSSGVEIAHELTGPRFQERPGPVSNNGCQLRRSWWVFTPSAKKYDGRHHSHEHDLTDAMGQVFSDGHFLKGYPMGILRNPPHRLRRLLLRFIDIASRPLRTDTASDPFHLNFLYFLDEVKRLDQCDVLELGARRSTIRNHFDRCRRYVGVDIHPGEGVDVACDIHELSSALAPQNVRFDAVVTISTFEHLAMPWKAVLEINKVMKPGGLLFIATHPTWPPHELPWDFWRFAEGAFQGLLNRATGFEIVRCNSGLPCTILPLGTEKSTVGILGQPAFMGISVVARKTAEARSDLQWNVSTEEILTTQYPLR